MCWCLRRSKGVNRTLVICLRKNHVEGSFASYRQFTLERIDEAYRVAVIKRNGLKVKQKRYYVDVSQAQVNKKLAALKKLTVPAYPVSPIT